MLTNTAARKNIQNIFDKLFFLFFYFAVQKSAEPKLLFFVVVVVVSSDDTSESSQFKYCHSTHLVLKRFLLHFCTKQEDYNTSYKLLRAGPGTFFMVVCGCGEEIYKNKTLKPMFVTIYLFSQTKPDVTKYLKHV